MAKTLLLIDANSLIHRAYHALPPLTSPSGEPVGALYGTASALLKILRERKPDYIAAAFDRPEPTFREEIFKEYKAHRPQADEALVHQIIKSRELFQKFNIPSFERAGFEADDVIATLAKKFGTNDLRVVILTGDLDTLQIVKGEAIVVLTPKKGLSETILYDEQAVIGRFGLQPTQLPDYKGFVGDPSDNIPGVRGVGPKTAVKALREFGSLEKIYKEGDEKKLGEKIWQNRERAFFSKKLAVLRDDIPFEIDLEKLGFRALEEKIIVKYFAELGFQSLVKRFLNTAVEEEKSPPTENSGGMIVIPDESFIRENAREMISRKIKIAFDWKEILKKSPKEKIALPLFDVKIAGWLLDPDQKDFSLEALARRFLQKEVTGDKTGLLSELSSFFRLKLREYELNEVFEKIEMPLIPILAKMETWGLAVDAEKLKQLQKEIEAALERSAREIYAASGEIFNINSSKQLGAVIFEKLGVKPLKSRKTKTGFRSTAVDVLNNLKGAHPIVNMILDYRDDFKINTTFVKPLLEAIAVDHRVRTTFIQTGTATGRIASEKPNLQNLPQESKWSKRLREAFVAPPGHSLVSFDYSQMELRLLAHVASDKKLQEAFRKGVDAHRLTAAQIFNVPATEVTETMRRVGKTLNFGVVYGMGAKAFSEVSGLSRPEAEQFIEEYFRDFPAIKVWQDKVTSETKTFGFVKNENGRRRFFLQVSSGSPRAEAEIERAAINMPIQSLEADILKLAMIESFKKLEEKGWLGKRVKLVLTIHDALLFEVGDDILKEILKIIPPLMENVYELSVPIMVETKIGKNLADLKRQENIL